MFKTNKPSEPIFTCKSSGDEKFAFPRHRELKHTREFSVKDLKSPMRKLTSIKHDLLTIRAKK
jgi:hypothetical protein